MDHLVFEVGLALVLMAAAALLSARLKFSIVPFLIVAGMIAGPHLQKVGIVDFSFHVKGADGKYVLNEAGQAIQFMGRVGVLFLLFYLGLEFSASRLIKSGRSIVTGGLIYIGINFTLGLLYAALLGWGYKEILIVAGITTISSSAIVAKVLVDLRRTANPETEMILGITMFEDVFLAVYLSIVSGIVLSKATSSSPILSAFLALGFILGMIIVGRMITPYLDRALRISSSEIFLLVVFAALFVVAGLAETIHVAEAIGALLVGSVLAETEHAERIEHLVVPFRDFFGAAFFFSFGLSVNPFTLGGAVGAALGAVALTLFGNILAGMIAGKSAKLSPQESFNIGFSIAGRGEFSIIVANLAKAGSLNPIIQPFSALYVLILAILGPLLTKESERIYDFSTGVLSRFQRSRPALPEAIDNDG